MTKVTKPKAPKTAPKPKKAAAVAKAPRAPRKTAAKKAPEGKVEAVSPKLSRAASKNEKEAKKEAVSPKLSRAASKNDKNKTTGNSKILELCLLLDCTGSMASWIERSKNTLKEIIQNFKKENQGLSVRVCFIGYRDIGESNRFDIFKFSEDLDAAVKFISTMRATGGGDTPEDV